MSSTVRRLSPENAANMDALRKAAGLGHRIAIHIDIKDPQSTYTTLDRIEGVLSITASTRTSFDDIDIEFVGTSKTSVERLTAAAAVSGRSEAFHQFLKLQDKSVQDLYPEDRVLEAKKTYTFPFLFVIPEQLLPKVCGHACKAPGVREAHLQLPPTMGDRECDRQDPATGRPLDDLAPDMVSTRYGVHVRIIKENEGTRETLANYGKKVRVVPIIQEQPPLPISDDDDEYRYRKEKVIRKGVLQGKAGTIVMETVQPSAVRMHACGNSSRPSTAKIMLRFDPADKHAAPPRLGNLASKLKVNTYFASTARQSYPTKRATFQDPSQGIHSEQLTLVSRKVGGPDPEDKSGKAEVWTTYESETAARRDSACSVSTFIPDASKDYKGKTFYVAQLEAPIVLPENKVFIPTFHSCLISRIYQVKFELHLQNKGVVGTIDLKLPIQVSCSGHEDWEPRQSSVVTDGRGEHELREEDFEEYFEPRTLHIPSEAFLGSSVLQRPASPAFVRNELPPSYSYYAPPIGVQTVPAY